MKENFGSKRDDFIPRYNGNNAETNLWRETLFYRNKALDISFRDLNDAQTKFEQAETIDVKINCFIRKRFVELNLPCLNAEQERQEILDRCHQVLAAPLSKPNLPEEQRQQIIDMMQHLYREEKSLPMYDPQNYVIPQELQHLYSENERRILQKNVDNLQSVNERLSDLEREKNEKMSTIDQEIAALSSSYVEKGDKNHQESENLAQDTTQSQGSKLWQAVKDFATRVIQKFTKLFSFASKETAQEAVSTIEKPSSPKKQQSEELHQGRQAENLLKSINKKVLTRAKEAVKGIPIKLEDSSLSKIRKSATISQPVETHSAKKGQECAGGR